MLLQRVERPCRRQDKIDFHLNPRNLGKMRISLVVQNERTNVHIQTETSGRAAAERRRSTIGTDDGCIWFEIWHFDISI